MSEPQIEIHCDGACLGNPGPGGWAALLLQKREHGMLEKMLSGSEPHTTNNRMELRAAIEGLRALKRTCHVDIFTDSQYVKKGMTEWISTWKLRDFKDSHNKPVKNVDLWQELDAQVHLHQVNWHWVRGHSGHEQNERVDVQARKEAERLR